MSIGRYVMRGRVFQPRAFAGWGLASNAPAPVTADPRDGVAIGFRYRTHTQTGRGRLAVVAFRSRTTEGRAWR